MFYFLVKMQRHDKVGIVDFSDDEFKDDIDVSYCPHCKEYGSKKNQVQEFIMRIKLFQQTQAIESNALSVAISMQSMNQKKTQK